MAICWRFSSWLMSKLTFDLPFSRGVSRRLTESSQFWTVADLIPEEYIWAIWECLARGLCVLAYGNENLDGEVWDRPEIMHLDIKPHNSEFLMLLTQEDQLT